jgi:lysophospholipase L1-like esterase
MWRRWLLAGVPLLVVAGVVAAGSAALLGDEDRAPAPTRVDRYVALGDSYTSAPGVATSGDARTCQRSTRNYPALVARELGVTRLDDRSCGGATTQDVVRSQFPQVGPQIDGVTGDTDLVTISLGVNDFGIFSLLVGACQRFRPTDPGGSPCRDSDGPAGEARMAAAIPQVGRRIAAVVGLVRERAPEARVLVVGYPRIVDPATPCPARLPLATGDHRWLDTVMAQLDQVTREAAERAGAEFVAVRPASDGHDLCADDPWINDRTSDPEAVLYHPFAEEQEAVAGLVVEQLR